MKKRNCPRVDEIFELTLDGKNSRFLPSSIARDYGYSLPGCYKYTGMVVRDHQTRFFKLVEVDYTSDWGELVAKLKTKGKIPGSQWLKAFAAKFSGHENDISVADNAWLRCLDEQEIFLRLDYEDFIRFVSAVVFDSLDLWLMEVPAPAPITKQSRH